MGKSAPAATIATDDLAQRLTAAADLVTSREAALDLAKRSRNQVIRQAVDNGMVGTHVARLARVSQPHVVRICGTDDSDDL